MDRCGSTGNPGVVRYDQLGGLGNLQPNVDPLRIYEARIATQLAGGSAIYCASQRVLYFHDSPEKRIDDAVNLVLLGLGRPTPSLPVRIDDVGYFCVARKISLDGPAYAVVHAALRLLGVEIRQVQANDPAGALEVKPAEDR